MNSATLIQKHWNNCNVLRGDGMSNGDVEQLTYLLCFKMADEPSRSPSDQPMITAQCAWFSLLAKDDAEVVEHYRHALGAPGQVEGQACAHFPKSAEHRDRPS